MTKEELIEYLKENLKIRLSRDTEHSWDVRNVLKVKLILDKQVIDFDTIYID